MVVKTKNVLRRVLVVGISFVMLAVSAVLPGVAAQEPGDTEENPILITSKMDLEFLAQEVNEGNSFKGKYIKLANDIYLTSNGSEDGKPLLWNSIGNCCINPHTLKILQKSKAFEGNFDGDGYTIDCNISGFVPVKSGAYGQSVFGYIGENGIVKNVNIRGIVSGKTGDVNPSAICSANCGTISSCKVRAVIDGKTGASGCCLINFGTISGCEINGKILSKDMCCSGICEVNYGDVKECKILAVLANCRDGGIVGDNSYEMPETGGVASFNYGKISSCSVSSYISNKNIESLTNYEDYLKQKSDGKNAYKGCAGGIVSTNNGLIESCKFTGSVNSYEVGGIAGINYETIKSCETNCHILGAVVGGISSQNIVGNKFYSGESVRETKGGLICDCLAKAEVKTFFLVGDIVCTDYWNDNHAVVENCKADLNVTVK